MFLFRLLVLLLLPSAALAAAKPTILVFGDSLSAGYGLPRGTGWVDLLRQRLSRQAPAYAVVNASVSGETTDGGRRRLAAVLAREKPVIVILELGANDALRGQPIDRLEANLEAMVLESKAQSTRVLLIGMRIPPNYGAKYAGDFAGSFARVAKRHDLPLVPFLLEGFAQRRELFQSDGIHPGAEAQATMLATVWKVLQPMLSAASSRRTKP